MRILFVMLVHEHVTLAAETALALVTAAQKARALVHLDANCSPNVENDLSQRIDGEPRLSLVKRRAACGWGSFGLVEAVLNALEQAEEEGEEYDYVILLSGACLPHRPIRQLERFLSENYGQEFIENGDESWIVGGWRQERYLYRFWFNHKTHPRMERAFFKLQRKLGLRRKFPDKLVPRFGSQWWALTWESCCKILAYNIRHPKHLRFFREVWIPDEMYFPTMLRHLAPDKIAGYGLTHYKFSYKGKPLVYHDDHVDHLAEIPKFFLRKADPEATVLRSRALKIAGEPDDGSSLEDIAAPYLHYERKLVAQTSHPSPGQIFYRDQWADQEEGLLRRVASPYVILLMPRQLAAQIGSLLCDDTFEVFGEVFAREEVDLGVGRNRYLGLSRSDRAIRDYHPVLYLSRLRQRCSQVPVITCSPAASGDVWKWMARDPHATIVACLPELAPWAQQTALARAALSQTGLQRGNASSAPEVSDLAASQLAQAEGIEPGDCRRHALLLAYANAGAAVPAEANLIDIPWRMVFGAATGWRLDLNRYQIWEEWQEMLVQNLAKAVGDLKAQQGTATPVGRQETLSETGVGPRFRP